MKTFIFGLLMVLAMNSSAYPTSMSGDIVVGGNSKSGIELKRSAATATPVPYDPLDDNPTGAFATHRFAGNTTENILRIRGSVTGEVDIWDIQSGTSNYKTTEEGDWVDGSGESWWVVRWYDQLNDSRSWYENSGGNQPLLYFDDRNDLPSVGHTNTLTWLKDTTNPTLDVYMNTATGYAFTTQRYTGTAPVAVLPWSLFKSFLTSTAVWGIVRGDFSGVGDDIYAYENITERYLQGSGGAYSTSTWYVIIWEHTSGNLYCWRDKVRNGPTSSAAITPTGYVYPSYGVGSAYAKSTITLFYNSTLSNDTIETISDYCDTH